MTDLSGTWLGTYWQEGVPTRFEFTLVQGGNSLSGSVLDDNYLGEANIIGEVIGRKITFTKTYLMGSRHSVDYAGTVSEDNDFMQGEWQIYFLFSGQWEAHRHDDNLTINLEILRRQTVPV
ncbi:MAG: hypothetical protein DSM107014_15205 [Gomphosphaeria aponina SAG 52.96 = DSM 107014]|uniref:Uncharacterized protein n=1 Tax=Gomphosphaeria aponina SAG 52.96 = DSM 107014 TaxID=1521640 RepID=A0A941GXP9_9CHRO|nr:hypothetical protein [Gomphosphaeria aponina SAG 52.96 = DSM 107014]